MHACDWAHDMSQIWLYVNEEDTLLRVIPYGFIADMSRRMFYDMALDPSFPKDYWRPC